MNYNEWMKKAQRRAQLEEVDNIFFRRILSEFYEPTISPELGMFRALRFLERECPMLATTEGMLIE